MQSHSTTYRPLPVKLIFNPNSGAPSASLVQLTDVITQLQTWNLVPEVYLVEQGSNLLPVVEDAFDRKIRMFVVCGGDGTIESVAKGLVGTRATLGIIPTGTQNNLAVSLGIPNDIPTAVALLRTGQRLKIDVGRAVFGETEYLFLEVCSVGLMAALFPTADDIQHGNWSRIGDFLAMLVASPPAKMHLVLNKRKKIHTYGHVMLATNTPYIGPRHKIAPDGSCTDGLLDVLIFADLSKMELLSHAAVQLSGGGPEDPRIQHYQVRSLDIDTNPPMPIMADGSLLGEGSLHIELRRHALAVMTGAPVPPRPDPEVMNESKPVGG
jgi:diacylglycerol kinase (ATP)